MSLFAEVRSTWLHASCGGAAGLLRYDAETRGSDNTKQFLDVLRHFIAAA